jgi:uncharacterized protein involved in exopolysaccharide biosynthesis
MLRALAFLWGRKYLIAIGTLTAAVIGVGYSLVATPVYSTRAVIYPKEVSVSPDKPSMGGIGAALNPLAGTSHLNRVDLVLNSRELARKVILANDLLPVLLPEIWDEDKRAWTERVDSGAFLYGATGRLQRMLSTKPDVYKMTIEVRVNAPTAEFSYRLLNAYLEALNEKTKENVIRGAEANREFLETQMSLTVDPQTREKIQELILREVETSMLLSANAFDLLEVPERSYGRESPKRKRIVLLSLLLGFVASCLAVLAAKTVMDAREEASA